jgi:hypothetical protein
MSEKVIWLNIYEEQIPALNTKKKGGEIRHAVTLSEYGSCVEFAVHSRDGAYRQNLFIP